MHILSKHLKIECYQNKVLFLNLTSFESFPLVICLTSLFTFNIYLIVSFDLLV